MRNKHLLTLTASSLLLLIHNGMAAVNYENPNLTNIQGNKCYPATQPNTVIEHFNCTSDTALIPNTCISGCYRTKVDTAGYCDGAYSDYGDTENSLECRAAPPAKFQELLSQGDCVTGIYHSCVCDYSNRYAPDSSSYTYTDCQTWQWDGLSGTWSQLY